MKAIILTSTLAAAVLIAATAGAARAESLDVTVPFDFVVHGHTLPAGSYKVDTDGPIVTLRGEHGNRAAAIVATMPAHGHDPAKGEPVLIFSKDGTLYRLEDIWESA